MKAGSKRKWLRVTMLRDRPRRTKFASMAARSDALMARSTSTALTSNTRKKPMSMMYSELSRNMEISEATISSSCSR